ncbi:MAG: sigma-54-dependent Fis family transcriptional regulator [Calditrichaeota bacterium]|nr:sigma-54-dependent Fis family transcriptional regulator [Calditrichota bacterium]
MYRILAIDDDLQFLEHVKKLLQLKHYKVDLTTNPYEALQLLTEHAYHCLLLDVKMPGMDGISLLQQIKQEYPQIPIIMISGQSTLSMAVDAIKFGAFDFLEKGSDTDRLLITLKNAIDHFNWLQERDLLLNELSGQYQMVGQSEAIRKIFHQIDLVAPTDAKVLITGETGTGKELVARAIHLRSKRATKPFVKVNCAAIPETLIESTFFGHRKGSFTGAVRDQMGKFEEADGGTIFLDEIGELPLIAQAKLLTVLQDGEIEKIGEQKPLKVDTRVIAATNKCLKEMIQEGAFREDLFHRINMIHIHIPPLRERVEDIPLLAEYFLKQFAETYNKTILGIAPAALQVLMQHDWPGNVRMLKNVLEKAVIFSRNTTLSAEEIMFALDSSQPGESPTPEVGKLSTYLEIMEKQFIRRALLVCKGNKQKAAALIGVDRATLWRKIKKYQLEDLNLRESDQTEG